MARCSNDVLMNKIGINKLHDKTEVSFTVLTDLPDCKKINTKNYVADSVAGEVSYNRYKIPVNRFECMRQGCINSGTLYITPATPEEGEEATPASVAFKAQFDATEFANGVVTMYAQVPEGATYPLVVKVALSSEDTFVNADVYEVTIEETDVKEDGFAPIAIDLTKAPTSTEGNGWVASESGAFIRVQSDAEVGISSISIFDDLDDFETSDVVKVGCLSDLSGTFDVPASTATCWSSGYDTSDLSFERTITGNSVTPNYWKLNPLHGKMNASTGWVETTVEKTIEEEGDFGKITLADMNQDECGFLGIQIADACNVTDSQLTRLTLPSTDIAIDEKHYILVANNDGSTSVYFSKENVGVNIIVSYPRTVEVERVCANKENVGSVRVRMTYKVTQTDGTELIYTFNNVLVTSFPANFTTDETEFAFTITIQPDNEGNFYCIDRVVA